MLKTDNAKIYNYPVHCNQLQMQIEYQEQEIERIEELLDKYREALYYIAEAVDDGFVEADDNGAHDEFYLYENTKAWLQTWVDYIGEDINEY
jgi:hypothetical protein